MTLVPSRRPATGGRLTRALLLLLPALFLSGCGGATRGCGSAPRYSVEVVTPAEEGRKDVVRVACSDEVYPAFMRLAFDYSTRHNVRFDLFQAQSARIPEILTSGGADLGVSGKNLSRSAADSGMVYVPLAYDGGVFLVSADTGVRSLTSAQVFRIYDGQVGNWSEVGGSRRAVHVVDRPGDCSLRVAISNALFRGKLPSSSVSLMLETSESAYYAMRNLSGYIAYAPLSRTVVEQFPCVPLTIDKQPPLASNLGKAPYPVRLEYGMIFPRTASASVNDFVNYLLSTEGIHQVASLGLVPAVETLSLATCHCRATEGSYAPGVKGGLAGTFTLAIVPELGAIQQENRYAGVARAIADGMQVNIQVKHLGSYDDVIREFGEGRIDGAFVGSLVYGRLNRRFGVTPVARPETEGNSRYKGIILVRDTSPVRDAEELKGRSVAYARNTSAGELFLMAKAREGGSSADRWFGTLVSVPSHGDAVRLLAAGKVDGAFVKDAVFRRMAASDPSMGRSLRIIASSPEFPENALVVATSLDGRQQARLLEVLLSLDRTEAGRKVLSTLGATRFIPTVDSDYANVYSMAGRVGLDLSSPGGRVGR